MKVDVRFELTYTSDLPLPEVLKAIELQLLTPPDLVHRGFSNTPGEYVPEVIQPLNISIVTES